MGECPSFLPSSLPSFHNSASAAGGMHDPARLPDEHLTNGRAKYETCVSLGGRWPPTLWKGGPARARYDYLHNPSKSAINAIQHRRKRVGETTPVSILRISKVCKVPKITVPTCHSHSLSLSPTPFVRSSDAVNWVSSVPSSSLSHPGCAAAAAASSSLPLAVWRVVSGATEQYLLYKPPPPGPLYSHPVQPVRIAVFQSRSWRGTREAPGEGPSPGHPLNPWAKTSLTLQPLVGPCCCPKHGLVFSRLTDWLACFRWFWPLATALGW